MQRKGGEREADELAPDAQSAPGGDMPSGARELKKPAESTHSGFVTRGVPAVAAQRSSGFRWSNPGAGEAGTASVPSSLAALEPNITTLDPRIAGVLERCFLHLCGQDSHIDARDLGTGLAIKSEYLAQRILCVLDADCDGLIDREDFVSSIRTLLVGSAHDRLLFAFRIHDLDGDSALDHGELQRMIALGLRECSVEASTLEATRLTEALLGGADTDLDQKISFAEFEAAVMKHGHVLEQITQSGLIWIAPDEHVREDVAGYASAPGGHGLRDRVRAAVIATARALDNRVLSIALLAIWAVLNVLLCEQAMMASARRGEVLPIQIAHAAGACLNLSCALLLVPMLRLTLTWVRRQPRLRLVPVDDALAFHRLLGSAVLALAVVHSVAHLSQQPQLMHDALGVLTRMNDGRTGAALLLCLLVLWVCALPRIRGRMFELFHFTHLLYFGFYALLFWHGPHFRYWGTVPVLWFAIDRGLRFKRRTHDSTVIGARALRSEVTRLEIKKPEGFTHAPTDFVFLRIPEIARYEWHPFTISSAPECDKLTFHIRKLGNWTRELHALVTTGRVPELPALTVELDGPYGAPGSHIFETRNSVLIGAGIGATPFASVLESIALNAQRGGKPPGVVDKVHFFWVDRDQRGFEWFRDLLATIERIDAGRHVDVHIHMTRGRSDAASAIVDLARELAHEKGRPDLVTGLKACTRMGHPDFLEELSQIAQLHAPEPVSVFFCGPPSLGRKLEAVCLQLGLPFRQEQF